MKTKTVPSTEFESFPGTMSASGAELVLQMGPQAELVPQMEPPLSSESRMEPVQIWVSKDSAQTDSVRPARERVTPGSAREPEVIPGSEPTLVPDLGSERTPGAPPRAGWDAETSEVPRRCQRPVAL